jgi:hypothetical protein
MDKSQLETIAVTALISVMAREVFTWIFSLAKSQVAKETTKAKVKKMFHPYIIVTIWNILALSFSVFMLVSNIRKTSPITRQDVLLISFWSIAAMLNFCLFCFTLFSGILYYRANRKQNHKEKTN